MAIEAYEVSKVREEAKILLAKDMLNSDDPTCRLNGKADLLEINFASKRGEELYAAAVSELEFIKDCIEKINSNRKYKNLSDDEAHQASQDAEWLYELIYRAENFLATTGTIPTDHFATMRLHPRFIDTILPAIEEFKLAMTSQETFNARLMSSPYRPKLIG